MTDPTATDQVDETDFDDDSLEGLTPGQDDIDGSVENGGK